jgi:hypothetical protein
MNHQLWAAIGQGSVDIVETTEIVTVSTNHKHVRAAAV